MVLPLALQLSVLGPSLELLEVVPQIVRWLVTVGRWLELMAFIALAAQEEVTR